MWTHYKQFILAKATGKLVIGMLLLYFVCASGLMGWGENHINALSGTEVQILDLCITGYSYPEVLAYLAAYSSGARSFAAMFNLTADTVYPLVYTAMLTMVLGWVFKEILASNTHFGYVLLLPLLMMFLDFLENIHIVAMLRKYPEIPHSIVEAGSMLTIAKWGLFGVILSIIIIGLVAKAVAGKKGG